VRDTLGDTQTETLWESQWEQHTQTSTHTDSYGYLWFFHIFHVMRSTPSDQVNLVSIAHVCLEWIHKLSNCSDLKKKIKCFTHWFEWKIGIEIDATTFLKTGWIILVQSKFS